MSETPALEQVEVVRKGLAKAMSDPACPLQFSPLLMEARQLLGKLSAVPVRAEQAPTREQIESALEAVASDGWSGDATAVGIPEAADAILALSSAPTGASEGGEADRDWHTSAVNMVDYWRDVIGADSYKPVKHGKFMSGHPTTVKAVLDQARGTETADVIVGLIFSLMLVRNREDIFIERIRELEDEARALPLSAGEKGGADE